MVVGYSVLRREAELREAGVFGLLRVGDVVRDIAFGDKGNVGRMVWDGSYLIVSFLRHHLLLSRAFRLLVMAGFGLHLLHCWRRSKICARLGIPTIVLSQGHTNWAYERQSRGAHQYQSLGRGDCNELAASARSYPNRDVSVVATSDPLFLTNFFRSQTAGSLSQRGAMGKSLIVRDHATICTRWCFCHVHESPTAFAFGLLFDTNTSYWCARAAQVEFTIAGARADVCCWTEHGAPPSDPWDGWGLC
jgi:hypothetical protein